MLVAKFCSDGIAFKPVGNKTKQKSFYYYFKEASLINCFVITKQDYMK